MTLVIKSLQNFLLSIKDGDWHKKAGNGKMLKKSGIGIIGDVPWGTHFCQFYQTKEDLMDILIPYFRSGLDNNELCVWVTSEPLKTEEAKEALREEIPNFDVYLEKGQIEFVSYNYWYFKDGIFDLQKVLNGWTEKLENALASGYDGLRLTENIFWMEETDWNRFIDYEEKLDALIGKNQMMALCTYFDKYSATETADIVAVHQFFLAKKGGKWERIENLIRKRARQEEHRIRRYNNILEGINRIFGNIVRAETEEELGNICLSVALEVTDSPIGFVNELGADGLLHDIAISDIGWDQCLMYDKTGHRSPPGNFILYGLYGRVINSGKGFFTNDPASHPDSIGLPQGHPQLTSFLGVPLVLNNGRTMGMLAVANRKGGYSPEQQEDLEAIAPAVTQALQRKKIERKRALAEQALRESEERERAVIESSKDAIIVTDTAGEGRILTVNPAATEMFGWAGDEMVGLTRKDIIDINDPRLRVFMDERMSEGMTRAELIYKRKDGTKFVGELASGYFVPVEGKKYAVSIIRDITERKQNEKALQDSEARLRRLYESGMIGVIYFTLDGRITDANDKFLEMVGYTRKDLQAGKINWKQITPQAYRFMDEYTIERLKTVGAAIPYEKEYIRKDGSHVPVIVGAAPLNEDRSENIAFVLDITERKRIEKALTKAHENLEEKIKKRTAELEKAYKALMENERRLSEAQKIAHIGSWEWDLVTDKLYWSDEMYRIYGLKLQELHPTYDAFLGVVHPDDREFVDNAVKKALKGKPYDLDHRIVLPNGKQRIIHTQGEVLFNEKGIPVQMRGATQDITEQREAEKAFLNAVTARKKEIHHRIKNNLQVISSLLDLQAEKFKNRKYIKSSEVLEAFRESQDRVLSIALIHEELHEGGGVDTLNFTQYLQRLVENLFLTYRFGNADIGLNMNLEEDVYFDMDTAVPLGMIVNELISNSLKHAFPDGKTGEIRIKLRREKNKRSRDDKIGFKSKERKNTSYTLTVSDNGIGIPESIDLENSSTLGMQLVTILIDQLDGELQLKRDPGTEFIIRITVEENS
jgi:hypothetical protein